VALLHLLLLHLQLPLMLHLHLQLPLLLRLRRQTPSRLLLLLQHLPLHLHHLLLRRLQHRVQLAVQERRGRQRGRR